MHVLLIHQAFVSPDDAGGTRHYELARRLVDGGHEFSIVASDLSYLSGKKCASDERVQNFDGVKVQRAWTYAALHRSFVWRIVSFLSFMVSSVWTALKVKNVDLVIGTSPPIFQAVSAWVISVVKWKPFLLEIRDLWPEFAVDMGVLKNPVLIWMARKLERFLYARANHLLVNSPAYRDYLIGLGIPEAKISFIANGVDPDMFHVKKTTGGLREEFSLADKYIVTYAGAMGMANNLEVVLEAAKLVEDLPEVHFLMVGDGKDRAKLEELAAQMHVKNVTFTGSRPKSQMPDILAESDACLAVLRDIPMFRTTYPNKVFDYMAASRPVLLAIDGVIRQVIEAANGGIPVPPGNPQAMADAVRKLYSDRPGSEQMGRSARDYVIKFFDRNQQASQFGELVQQIGKKKVA
ncbi:glycosyltransferase family 4 protein [Schlesneria sp. T3-172]|uniref:glycosyltransferase family 4 protein n=1 Tax=Schlesneria sphaerica TaxID=3373610 RepID=UPI0037C7B158